MDDELGGGFPTLLATWRAMPDFLSLLVAASGGPSRDRERLDIFGLHHWAEPRAPLRWFVPDVEPFACVLDGVQRLPSTLWVSSIAGAHHLFDRTAMLASQVVCGEPVHDSGQVPEPSGRIVCVAKVVGPAVQEGIDTAEQVQFRDLRVGTHSFHLGLQLSFFFWGNAQSQPVGPIRVPLSAEIIAQKAEPSAEVA